MAEPQVTLAIDGAIATVTLNRPDKMNALTPDMITALAEHATRIDEDTSLRCAILTAPATRRSASVLTSTNGLR